MINYIKYTLAIIILVSFFLPLGSCQTRYADECKISPTLQNVDPTPTKKSLASNNVLLPPEIENFVPAKLVSVKDVSTFLLIPLFFFPVFFYFCKKPVTNNNKVTLILEIFEITICGFLSFYLLRLLYGSWYRPTIYGHIAVGASISYFFVLAMAFIKGNNKKKHYITSRLTSLLRRLDAQTTRAS